MFRSLPLRTFFFVFVLACVPFVAFGFDDFKPVPLEELAMKDNPKQPGAHAMILEWTIMQDDTASSAIHYRRIKVFTEEGKKYGDMEIPYYKSAFNIKDIKARTIHPDGTIVPFNGQVYDKILAKGRGLKVQAKTFSLSDVQPGSVLEYRYRATWDSSTLYSNRFQLQDDLFISKGVFTIKPYDGPQYGFRWIGVNVPNGKPLQKKFGGYTLEINDVPAFDEESYSPPARELKPRIEFFYMPEGFGNDETFWKIKGQQKFREYEEFIGRRGYIQNAVGGIVSASDPAEVKLRKIYSRVQELKNLSFTRDKTEQESRREKIKEAYNSEDVLKRGYGYHWDINRLFVALARAAGMDANEIAVSRRDEVFFRKTLLDEEQLGGELVLVKADNKEWYLDPGTAMCPFGLIPWKMTGVQAYSVSKDGGTFITTPQPQSKDAITRRTARLKVDGDSLKGTVVVDYHEQEALRWRLSEVTSDEAEVKTDLEKEMKDLLPSGSTVTLTAIQNIKEEDRPLIVSYQVEMPSIGSTVGSRMLLPLEIFQMSGRNPFLHEKRVHPLYFEYPFQQLDEVTIEMPKDFTVENLPAAKQNQTAFGYYDAVWTQDGKTLTMKRRLAISALLIPIQYYPAVRTFYQQVNGADQETVVLRAQTVANK